MQMTLFNWHADGVSSRFPIACAVTYATAVLKTIHRAIIAVKLRRLRYELMFHGEIDNDDARKFPQRPMLLGDKWDF